MDNIINIQDEPIKITDSGYYKLDGDVLYQSKYQNGTLITIQGQDIHVNLEEYSIGQHLSHYHMYRPFTIIKIKNSNNCSITGGNISYSTIGICIEDSTDINLNNIQFSNYTSHAITMTKSNNINLTDISIGQVSMKDYMTDIWYRMMQMVSIQDMVGDTVQKIKEYDPLMNERIKTPYSYPALMVPDSVKLNLPLLPFDYVVKPKIKAKLNSGVPHNSVNVIQIISCSQVKMENIKMENIFSLGQDYIGICSKDNNIILWPDLQPINILNHINNNGTPRQNCYIDSILHQLHSEFQEWYRSDVPYYKYFSLRLMNNKQNQTGVQGIYLYNSEHVEGRKIHINNMRNYTTHLFVPGADIIYRNYTKLNHIKDTTGIHIKASNHVNLYDITIKDLHSNNGNVQGVRISKGSSYIIVENMNINKLQCGYCYYPENDIWLGYIKLNIPDDNQSDKLTYSPYYKYGPWSVPNCVGVNIDNSKSECIHLKIHPINIQNLAGPGIKSEFNTELNNKMLL